MHLKHAKGTTILIDKEGSVYINAVNDKIYLDGDTQITGKLDVSKEVTAKYATEGESVTLTGHKHPYNQHVSGTGNVEKTSSKPKGGT